MAIDMSGQGVFSVLLQIISQFMRVFKTHRTRQLKDS